jgi:hypothetical protein
MSFARPFLLAVGLAGCSVYTVPTGIDPSSSDDAATIDGSIGTIEQPEPIDAHETPLDAGVIGDGAPSESREASPADALDGSVPPQDVVEDAAPDAGRVVDAGCKQLPSGDASSVVEVLHWRFDEGTGASAQDSSGHCFVGTLQGGAAWAAGKVGPSGVDLQSASNAFVDFPTPVLDTTKPYTAAAWAKFRRADGFQTVLGIDGNVEQAFQLQINNGKFSVTARSADDSTIPSIHVLDPTPPLADVWYHLAVVYDGASLTLYVNGMAQGSLPYTTPWMATRRTVVGRGKHASSLVDFVEGTIDDVIFYQGALSAQDIAKLATP